MAARARRPWRFVGGLEPLGLTNLFEQVANIVTDDPEGLKWAIADLEDILEDLEPGPEQGAWVAGVCASPPIEGGLALGGDPGAMPVPIRTMCPSCGRTAPDCRCPM